MQYCHRDFVYTFSGEKELIMGVYWARRGLAAGPGPGSYHPRDPCLQGSRGGNAENARTTFAPPRLAVK